MNSQVRSLIQKKQKQTAGFQKDWILLLALAGVLVFGLVVLGSATTYVDQKEHPGDLFYTLKKQGVFLGMALAGMLAVSRFDYHRYSGMIRYLYPLAVLFGILVLFFGKEVNGQKRWFALGPLSFQPAEFAKIVLILTLSGYFHHRFSKNESWSLIIGCAALALPVFLPVISANLSSGIIIAGIAFVMLYSVSGKRVFLILAVLLAAGLCVFLFQSGILAGILDEYQMNRIYAWLNPEEFPRSNGFQILQGLYAIGAGGLFGVGMGNSFQKLGFLPEVQNDMIFSIICEETGLFGAVLLMGIFSVLLWRLMIVATRAADDEGFLLVTGITAHIGIQILLNIAVVTNTIPNTGISLPFISYGGSSLLFLLSEIGIVLNVSSQSKLAN